MRIIQNKNEKGYIYLNLNLIFRRWVIHWDSTKKYGRQLFNQSLCDHKLSCGDLWHWAFLCLSPQKRRCQNSPHLYEFYEHKQIISEGQSSCRFLEWTFIKVSNTFSEAVNNGEGGCFGFLPLFLSGNLQWIPIYMNSLTLEGSVPFFFFFSWKNLLESQLYYCFREMTRGSASKGKSRNLIYTVMTEQC